MTDDASLARMRLDVWLDIACLFRTRSEAQNACRMGRVDVNGGRAKPHRDVKRGDEIEIRRPLGRRQRLVVRGLAEKHIAKPEARLLYEDTTPEPTPEEVEARLMARLIRPIRPAGTPDKRQRRELRRMKKGYDER